MSLFLSQMKRSDAKYDALAIDDEVAFVDEVMGGDVSEEIHVATRDFLDDLSDATKKDERDSKDRKGEQTTSVARDMSTLSARDRRKILDKQHPELLPLLSYFSGVVKDLNESTNVATSAIFQGEPGTAEVRIVHIHDSF